MKREQREVLEEIGKIQKNQGLLLEKAKNCQQQFFQLFSQRRLLGQQMLHKHIDEVLEYMPGSFARTALHSLYLSVCLEMRVELNPEEHAILKRLIEWSDQYPELKAEKILPLMSSVIPDNSSQGYESYEDYLTFLNFVGGDLIKLIKGPSKSQDDKSDKYLKSVDSDDLISFLMSSLPKVLYNIILPKQVLPPEQKSTNESMQILYRVPSFEYYVRSKSYYATLIKILVKILVKSQLKQSQQKLMMEIVFRYFYAYHHDKNFSATDIFVEGYNNLNDSVRFAMADQFVLFLKIVRKIGKGKFVEFLLNKSPWLKEINSKVSDNNFVGYVKETLNPFPGFRVPEVLTIPNGKIEYRWFQILSNFSLFYFVIEVPSKDITLRLHYLGDITDSKASSTELLCYQKRSGVIKANIMAAKRGLYMFQFDNSYSWVNNKTVKFEKIILAPVEFQSVDEYKWQGSFYGDIPINQMGDKSKIIQIKKVLPPKPEISYEGVANITKIGGFYNLKLGKGGNMYEFQTESEDKLVKKFTELVDSSGKIKWMIAGELLEDTDDLKKLLKEKEKTTEEPKKVKSPKQQEAVQTEVIKAEIPSASQSEQINAKTQSSKQPNRPQQGSKPQSPKKQSELSENQLKV